MADTKLPDVGWYIEQFQDLREDYTDLRDMQGWMDKLDHVEYEAPEALRRLQWFVSFKSPQPRVSLDAGTRALSTLQDDLRIETPTVMKAVRRQLGGEGDPDSGYARQLAGEWEQSLQWQMRMALRRKQTLKSDMARSALKFGEITGNLIHLPTQIKAIRALGGNAARQQAALANGQFALALRNPQDVYTRYSEYMNEMVCAATLKEAQQIVDMWGDRASDLRAAIQDGHVAPNDPFIELDWTDRNSRTVLLFTGDDDNAVGGEPSYVVLPPQAPQYPFMSWLSVVGGSELEYDLRFRRSPMLMAVYLSELWIKQNVVGSLMISEPIATFGRPGLVKKGPGAANIITRYGTPGGEFIAGPLQDVKTLEKQGVDPGLREVYAQFSRVMDESTIARVLVTTESQPGEPYSGFDLRIKTALGTLMPFKQMMEAFQELSYRTKMLYCHYSGVPIEGFGQEKKLRGKRYQILPEDIDPAVLYLEVSQEAYAPVDRIQQVNAAQLLSRMNYPNYKILEELGSTNPESDMRVYVKEQLSNAYLEGKKQQILASAGDQLRQLIEQRAQQLHEEMMQPAAGGSGEATPEMAAGGVVPENMTPPGEGMNMEGIGGQGFAPPAGGTPPIRANPKAATFEGATGRTRRGEVGLGR